MKQALCQLLFLTTIACSASAQWVPISGRIVTTTQAIAADGTVNAKWTTTSIYSRSSSGSILIQRIGRSGKPATATLLDYGKSQRAYSLKYHYGQVTDRHHALDHEFATHPPRGLTQAQQKVSLGNDKVNGIDCFIVPIYDTGANRSRILIGKAWLAPSLDNLVMREDVVRNSPTGGKLHVVREFKISSQNEPDPTLFSTDRTVVGAKWKSIANGK